MLTRKRKYDILLIIASQDDRSRGRERLLPSYSKCHLENAIYLPGGVSLSLSAEVQVSDILLALPYGSDRSISGPPVSGIVA